MKHFRLIRCHVDIEPIREELAKREEVWQTQTGRQERAPAQRHTQSIPLRGLRRSRVLGRRRRDVMESRFTSLAADLPLTCALAKTLATEFGGALGRARLARLGPGRCVLPHVDRGAYYRAHDRYHLVVSSPNGSVLSAGGETATLREGELWWFDNKALHDAVNQTGEDRVHLIFDVAHGQPKAAFGLRSLRVDPVECYRSARESAEVHLTEQIAGAVRTYAAACSDPRRWGEVLAGRGRLAAAEAAPIAVLAEMHWPGMRRQARRRCESAIAWALAQLDLERITLDEVADAIRHAGGLDTVHAIWQSAPESMLYGHPGDTKDSAGSDCRGADPRAQVQ